MMRWYQVFMVVWFTLELYYYWSRADKMRQTNNIGDAIVVTVASAVGIAVRVFVLHCGGFWQ